jgi:hypothetical protein
VVLGFIHLVACAKFGVLHFHEFAMEADLETNSMAQQFFFCVFWAMATMFSLSNVLVPDLYLETGFSLFCMVLGMLLFAYIIGTVSTVVNDDRVSAQYQQIVSCVNRFLKTQDLDEDTVSRVRGYFTYAESTRQEKQVQEVLAMMPDSLKEEITWALVKNIFEIDLFAGLPQGFISGLCARLNIVIVLPNEVLFKAGDEVCRACSEV